MGEIRSEEELRPGGRIPMGEVWVENDFVQWEEIVQGESDGLVLEDGGRELLRPVRHCCSIRAGLFSSGQLHGEVAHG
jgi:hypothetical protein